MKHNTFDKYTIAVIGLGYVGLPLAIAFSKYYKVIGFDINSKRIINLQKGNDNTKEITAEVLQSIQNIYFTYNADDIACADCYIVTVPTPIDAHKKPNLAPLLLACAIVGSHIQKNNIVIFESTVYPGCTEQECVPILEKHSKLMYNKDFFCGYSPERINPGDTQHRIDNIQKITSGSTLETANFIDNLYKKIVSVGTYKVPSIQIAEAAKVIENIQRDVNIALMNELAIVFHAMGIDTKSVLDAAGSKWNFLPFTPGLVGGHCIGVDPYYLTYKAQALGYIPEVILSGRRVNDDMGLYIARQLVKTMIQKSIPITGSTVLVMGLAFKENCPDIRNTKVVDIIRELQEYTCHVDVYDPYIDTQEAENEYALQPIEYPKLRSYDAVVLAVAHKAFMCRETIYTYQKKVSIFVDVKSVFAIEKSDFRL